MLTTAERNQMLQVISDLSKDAYGYRVRRDYGSMSDEELESNWNHFMDIALERAAIENEREQRAFDDYDARLVGMMAKHGIAYDTAVRWDLQAHGIDTTNTQDIEFYFWDLHLDFHAIRKYTSMVMEGQALAA